MVVAVAVAEEGIPLTVKSAYSVDMNLSSPHTAEMIVYAGKQRNGDMTALINNFEMNTTEVWLGTGTMWFGGGASLTHARSMFMFGHVWLLRIIGFINCILHMVRARSASSAYRVDITYPG